VGSSAEELQAAGLVDHDAECGPDLQVQYRFFASETSSCSFSATRRENVAGYGTEVSFIDTDCTAGAYASCFGDLGADPCNLWIAPSCQALFDDCSSG
jgi:hypothetical protein